MRLNQREQSLEKMARAREAERDLERVGAILDERRRNVIASVFEQIRIGALDPQSAVQSWLRMNEIERLERHLQDEIRAGTRAGEALLKAEEREARKQAPQFLHT